MTNKGDQIVDKGADRLQELSDKAATRGGIRAKLAQPLADDAAFLRKLKPSLMAARARGDLPTDQKPGSGTAAPPGPQLGRRKPAKGPNPFVVAAAAFAVGIALAKLIDWRGHAHPRN